MKVPACSGYKDEWNDDYNCFAVHDRVCDECICTYPDTGGLYDPETGKKWSRLAAWIAHRRLFTIKPEGE